MAEGRALDVICVRRGEDSYRSTEFFACFKFAALHGSALVMLGLQQSADWQASSRAFPKSLGKVPAEQTEHEANRLGLIEVYCNNNQCSDVLVTARQSNNGRLLFLEAPDADSDVSVMTLTTRPSSSTLSKLGLVDGENKIEFRMIKDTPGSGTSSDSAGSYTAETLMGSVTLSLFCYNPSTRLVVMDIDGTITKADVKGYLYSVYMGRYDFVHHGVAALTEHIAREYENVRFVYVTSRPLEHMKETKLLLHSVEGGPLQSGPIFMNHESLATALVQEAVMRNSAALKTSFLSDIRGCFVADTGATDDTPFVLGFGNRNSDHQAYRNGAKLSDAAVFIVDTESVVRTDGGKSFTQGYSCQNLREHIAVVLRAR